MDPDVLNTLAYWVKERESIRFKKEDGERKPWTTDPIFQQFKFCNVKREDDFVTRWFAHNWRHERFWDSPNFIAAIMLGRTINWPPTMDAMGFPVLWDAPYMEATLQRLMDAGEKVWTGAYMITAGPTGIPKSKWVIGNSASYANDPPKLDPTSLQKSWETIMAGKYPCVGPFIAGQVIADLKQTRHLNRAADWWDWAPVGPGSMRGINRVYGRKISTSIGQDQGLREMRVIKKELGLELCLQDVQNCLCELDKYMRVKLGQGKPRSSYPGR
jgi:hypothetical protein